MEVSSRASREFAPETSPSASGWRWCRRAVNTSRYRASIFSCKIFARCGEASNVWSVVQLHSTEANWCVWRVTILVMLSSIRVRNVVDWVVSLLAIPNTQWY